MELCVTTSLTAEQAAAWTQAAVASISIVAAVFIGWYQGRATLTARKIEARESRMRSLDVTVELALSLRRATDRMKQLQPWESQPSRSLRELKVIGDACADIARQLDAQVNVDTPMGAAQHILSARRQALAIAENFSRAQSFSDVTNSGLQQVVEESIGYIEKAAAGLVQLREREH